MLFVSGGLQRTGSTVMWQIMGDLVLDNGGEVHTSNQNVMYWAEEWANSGDLMLAKSHFYKSTFTPVIDKIRVVMTVRDPRDVVVSLARYFETTPLSILRGRRFTDICQNRRDWITNMPPEQLHIVKYEDYMKKPYHVVSDVYRFMDLDFGDIDVVNTVDYWTLERNKERVKRKLHIKDREYVSTRHIYSGKVGQFWRLPGDQLDRIEDMAADWMEEHNYIPYDNPAEDE